MTRLLIISTLLLLLAGTAYSVHEALTNKYTLSGLPQQGEPGFSFWNPHSKKDNGGQSWERKYKDWPTDKRASYPSAKTALAWTTDGDHLTMFIAFGSIRALIVIWVFALAGEALPWPVWKKWAAGVGLWLMLAAVQAIGFHLMNQIIL